MKKTPKLINFGRDRSFVSLFYVILSFLVASISAGINVVVFPAILIENNIGTFLTSLAVTSEMIFSLIAALLVFKIILKFGATRAVILTTLIYASITYFIFYYQNYLLWLILQSTIGICWLFLYIIRQAWINNLVSDRNRSIIVALISSIFCTGFVAGSSIVKIFGALNHTCLVISTAFIILAGILLLLTRGSFPETLDSDHVNIKMLIEKAPNESLARFLLDFQAGCVIFLGVLFGTKIGLKAEDAGLLIAAFMASGILDLYAGVLAKYYDRTKLIAYAFFGCFLSFGTAIFFYQDFYILMACFFCFGLACAMIMVATLTNVNDKFDKSQLVAANATFQAIGSLGTIIGCLVGGILMQIFGFYGFFATILFAIVSYLVYFGYRSCHPEA